MSKKRQSSSKNLWIGIGVAIALLAALWVPVIHPAYLRHKAAHDVRQLLEAVNGFAKIEGDYPTGDFATICRLLRGETVGDQNTRKLDYVESYAVNAQGEFVDPWGKPYRIAYGQKPRVYSTGPNQIDEEGKGDDIVAE